MIRLVGKAAYKLASPLINKPVFVQYCSQTIYEALLGCCRLWEVSRQEVWRQRANRILGLLRHIQRPDGGFDIGYDFNFSLWHRKGDSTSPELVALLALVEYGRLFGVDLVRPMADRAARWIKNHAIYVGDEKAAVPYSPYTIKEVVVHNGTSFAAGSLGCYLRVFNNKDDELRALYRKLVAYLDSVMHTSSGLPGRFWYYCDQNRPGLALFRQGLVDYYHQMQQVEMHAMAEEAFPVLGQKQMVRDAADHVVALFERYSVPPYYNKILADEIHLWGLCSVGSGLLAASRIMPERAEIYQTRAGQIFRWIVTHGWNGEHFEDVVSCDGRHLPGRLYMVRSDAWVFAALAAWLQFSADTSLLNLLERCYKKMESVDFSGFETHASSLPKKCFLTALDLYRKNTQG